MNNIKNEPERTLVKDIVDTTMGIAIIACFLIIVIACFYMLFGFILRNPEPRISDTITQGNTKYIVRDEKVFNKSFFLWIVDGKENYSVEVQKAAKDKHGIKVWEHVKTVDYGTHKPNLAN